MFDVQFKSGVNGVDWLTPQAPTSSALSSVLLQFEKTQWWSPERLIEKQMVQLSQLLKHTIETVPYYQNKFKDLDINFDQELTYDIWRNIPILKRKDIQDNKDTMLSKMLPKTHGKVGKISTSGSTGRPIDAWRTTITNFFWMAVTLRDHIWRKRDLNEKMAIIKFMHFQALYPEGAKIEGWGPSSGYMFETGPCYGLEIFTPVSDQLTWLKKVNPGYIETYPSNLKALLEKSRDEKIKFEGLKEVITLAEHLKPEIRELCQEVWGVPVTDMYSAQELGYVALQCPENNHYHIQSEVVFVEILDEDDNPVQPGEAGRVIVTPLHNFLMPLIRYEVGDYAVLGKQCSCGRGLPVLEEIKGRVRNMLQFPNGEKMWPLLVKQQITKQTPVQQLQVIQHSLDDIELKTVASKKLTKKDKDIIIKDMQRLLQHEFPIRITELDEIERTKNGKFEDFISHI